MDKNLNSWYSFFCGVSFTVLCGLLIVFQDQNEQNRKAEISAPVETTFDHELPEYEYSTSSLIHESERSLLGIIHSEHPNGFMDHFFVCNHEDAQFPVISVHDEILYHIASESKRRQEAEQDLWNALGELEDRVKNKNQREYDIGDNDEAIQTGKPPTIGPPE